ncbi:phage terminase large subunit family protein [Sphingomonas nostoxanthinifaciens]|uniref:phage terminase large subunit family protein n=1 Tax=Sphingomonas nostoxanthinifaciens TaxID=2872652 RepID=UPI001CC1E600|nr:phage terminase large subunit family protein [Sphingomonas nostoxanthinifaciens]UAK25657.1 phage terminase large subunit family protein [Sphingomonas nostoxanthinifaciens]
MRKSPAKSDGAITVAGGEIAKAVRSWIAGWKPRVKLGLSEWSDIHARLDNGRKFRAFPFQRGIADAFTDPATIQISVMKSTRIGYSQIVQNYAPVAGRCTCSCSAMGPAPGTGATLQGRHRCVAAGC